MLVVEFPVTETKLNKMTITPADAIYAAFKVSVTVKTSVPKVAFKEKTVTMNRYKDFYVENTIPDTEGFGIVRLTNLTIKKGSNDIDNNYFGIMDNVVGGNKLTFTIPQQYDDKIANGDYTVSVTLVVNIGGVEKELAACSFKLKVTQPAVKLSISSANEPGVTAASQKVYLYPNEAFAKISSSEYTIHANCGEEVLEIAEISVTPNGKKIYTGSTVTDNDSVVFHAEKDEDTYKEGKNTYVVTAKVKKKWCGRGERGYVKERVCRNCKRFADIGYIS